MKPSKMTSWLQRPIIWIFAAIIALVILIFRYCSPSPQPGRLIIREAVKAPVAIAFINANRLQNNQISNVKVTLIDPDSMVVTANGIRFSTLTITNGVMTLALKQKANTSDIPYRFTLKVEADGYSSTVQNILITRDESQYAPIYMAKLDDLPNGMASAAGSISLTNGIVGKEENITPNKVNGVNGEMVNIRIAKGTQLIYCNPDAANRSNPKNLTYQVSYATPMSLAASRTFPAGPLVTDALDIDGTTIARPQSPFYFGTAGWINLEMFADDEQVSGFSQPLTITVPIPDTLPKPGGGFFKTNDTIGIWSLNDRGVWRRESMGRIEGSPGKLMAKISASHLSTWNLDYKVDVCASPINLAYTNSTGSQINNRLCEILNARTGTLIGRRTLDFLTIPNSPHQIINSPNNIQMALGVFPVSNTLPYQATSSIFSCANPTASLTIPAAASLTTINISFEVRGNNGTPYSICNNAVWFSPCTDPSCGINCTYQFGGMLNIPIGNTRQSTFNSPSGTNCIKLWYTDNGLISQEIVFNFDFPSNHSPTPTNFPATYGGANGSIEHSYVGQLHRFVFIEGQGIQTITQCL